MCDYCDCRDLPQIRLLSDDHDRIRDLLDLLRRALVEDGEASGAPVLAALQRALGPHLVREEVGLLAQLAGRSGFDDYLDELIADHARVRGGLLARAADRPGWSEGLTADLDELAAHIELEEYDLFPASRMIIDDAGWAQVQAAVDQLDGVAGAIP